MLEIATLQERPRGCGYRKPGGLYLMADGPSAECGKLPYKLEICPACGQGIKPCRSWTWIDPAGLLAGAVCQAGEECREACPLAAPEAMGPTGLLWIGRQFYPTPQDFLAEARTRGVSRRLPSIPNDFEPGKTWVMFAHRDVFPGPDDEDGNPTMIPGIFQLCRPSHVEYVVQEDDPEEKLERLAKRGVRLVRIEQLPAAGETPLLDGPAEQ